MIEPINNYIVCEEQELGGIIKTGETVLVVTHSKDPNIPVGAKIKTSEAPIKSNWGMFIDKDNVICTY